MASPGKCSSLLTKFELSEKDCGIKVSKKDLDRVANNCEFPYERLAPYLDVKQVSDIEREGKSEPGRRTALLERWNQMKGSDATYRALITALLDIEHRNDAEKICKWLRTSKSATPCPAPVLQEPIEAPSGNVIDNI